MNLSLHAEGRHSVPPPIRRSHLAEESTLGRRLGIACAVTALVFVLEVAGGVLTRSLALLSDAGHVFADFFALALSAYAFGSRASRPTRAAPSAITAPRCSPRS